MRSICKIFKKNAKPSQVCCDNFEQVVRVSFMQQEVTVFSMLDLYNLVQNYLGTIYGPDYLSAHSIVLYSHGKLLQRTKSLVDYNWGDNNPIVIRAYALFGGSPSDIENYVQSGICSYSVILERELIHKKTSFEVQSLETEDTIVADAEFAKMVSFMEQHVATYASQSAGIDILSILENFWLTFKLARKCTNADDYITLACTSFKLFTGKSYTRFVIGKAKNLFNQLQSDDVGDLLASVRKMVNFTEAVGENPFFKKMTGLYSYLLVQGFLTRFGLTLTDEDYSRMEIRAMQQSYSSKKGLWMSVFDTTLFICERVHEWKLTGDISVFLHSEGAYGAWSKEADRLLALAPFTGNLEAHNTTYFSFISDLNDAVEKGEAYTKFSHKAHGFEVQAIAKKYANLRLLKNTEITKQAAQKERKAPFGALVYGKSSVGKSTFSKMLFYYYGKLIGLPIDDHFRYVRNPASEHWCNFDSSMWCIQIDDAAFLLPKKTSDIDPTLKEIIQVGNGVPYVPVQAALEDKGKTPVLSELLIVTSNAIDLNVREYFWCPLAVQRRLPFVICIVPKDKYSKCNGAMLDPTRLPVDLDGYPDFWDITIKKVVPDFDGERDFGRLETIAEYSDINLFLQDYARNILAHRCVQERSLGCDSYMRDIEVCVICHKPGHKMCAEVQAGEDAPTEWLVATPVVVSNFSFSNFVLSYFWKFYCWTIHMSYMMWLLQLAARWTVLRGYIFRWVLPTMNDRMQIILAGRINGNITGPRKWKMALGVISVLIAGFSLYVAMKPKNKKYKMEEQGNVFSTTEEQLEKEVRRNVWYNPTMELTKFDVPQASQSLVSSLVPDVRSLFSNNCVRLLVQAQVDGQFVTRTNAGVFVKGHFCLTNNHAFRADVSIYRVTIIKMNGSQGVSSNITVTVRSDDLIRRLDSDLVMFDVRAMPPYKDIRKFWSINKGEHFTRAVVLRRGEDGSLEEQDLFNLQHSANFPIESLGIKVPITLGKGPRITAKGDCGALSIAITPRGPVIFGIHIIGYEDQCGILCIDIDIINNMITEHEAKFGEFSLVQGGGEPQLVLNGVPQKLTEPHHKSLFRYLPEGTLNIYGSFAGFRPKPKSSVCATSLQQEMLDHFQCEVNHGKPCMEGWEPWRKNVVEMVKPTVNYRKDILTMCVNTFTDDIISGLPQGWEGRLVFLSRKASVNGLPGVRFVDKLNTNTSMGFPWNCTKKRYLNSDIDEIYPDGVDFTSEVWERVDKIEQCYREGKRAYPIFTGHLKDEPTALAKIEAKKTRVFTGGPVDWSIVVRSRLLTFVKLLQENKFLFEAGPGTVCQSSEWGHIHSYLTTFGDDRIIAGDYGKFDKRMIADFILAAFRIIASVYEKAGFSPEEVREIMCIGEDTAFPVVNANGDLVEFFGTNPSGHPLTVIINSIVNSLYMRYCYVILNPEHESVSFKNNVHLFTYGDDNIMGVDRTCDWFNHTGIQVELAGIGVEYTMADKESQSVPFINIKDCQFLKRTWRFDTDIGDWLCPLEEASIHKSLTMWCPSKSIDEYAQMVAVISSANSEYFFYGRETFEKHHEFFKSVLAKDPYSYYVGKSTLPSWGELVERFNQAGSNQ